jgi:hypothetical protein
MILSSLLLCHGLKIILHSYMVSSANGLATQRITEVLFPALCPMSDKNRGIEADKM